LSLVEEVVEPMQVAAVVVEVSMLEQSICLLIPVEVCLLQLVPAGIPQDTAITPGVHLAETAHFHLLIKIVGLCQLQHMAEGWADAPEQILLERLEPEEQFH
jgi:hypothetical protein